MNYHYADIGHTNENNLAAGHWITFIGPPHTFSLAYKNNNKFIKAHISYHHLFSS